MKRTIAMVILLVACGKDEAKNEKHPEPATKTVVEPKPEPPKKKQTTAAAFGKTPAAPFGGSRS